MIVSLLVLLVVPSITLADATAVPKTVLDVRWQTEARRALAGYPGGLTLTYLVRQPMRRPIR